MRVSVAVVLNASATPIEGVHPPPYEPTRRTGEIECAQRRAIADGSASRSSAGLECAETGVGSGDPPRAAPPATPPARCPRGDRPRPSRPAAAPPLPPAIRAACAACPGGA